MGMASGVSEPEVSEAPELSEPEPEPEPEPDPDPARFVFGKSVPVKEILQSMERILAGDKFSEMDLNILFDCCIRTDSTKTILLPSVSITNGLQSIVWPESFFPEFLKQETMIFLPMMYKDHWILVVVGPMRSRFGIHVYDSYKMFSTCFEQAIHALEDWLQNRYSIRLRRTLWKSCSQQSSSSLACGMFIVAYAMTLQCDPTTFNEEFLDLGMDFEKVKLLPMRSDFALRILRIVNS